MATFQAKRPFSSSELLALQRQKVEKSLNIPPSINLQDSSELTARVRKNASVLKTAYLPGQPTRESSGNMVKFNDCSVVQAMVEGSVYRAASYNRQVRTQYISAGCQTILDNPVTYPKAITCEQPIPISAPRVDCFDPVIRFGMRRNDNKAVFLNYTPPIVFNTEWGYNGYEDAIATCEGTFATIRFVGGFVLPGGASVTSIEVSGYESTWEEGEGYLVTIPGIALPLLTEDDLVLTFTLLINGGAYTTTATITIDDHFGNPLSSPQLYGSNAVPTDTGGSLFFPGTLFGYMCAGSNSDYYVPSDTDFTIMWWQDLSNVPFPRPFSLGSDASGDIGLSIEGGNGLYMWYPGIDGGADYYQFNLLSSINDSAWHHVALIRDAGTVTVYVDGVSNDSSAYSGPFGSATNKFVLGQNYSMDNAAESFSGRMTQFVFDNGTARYTGDFTAPLNVTSNTDTVLLLNVSSQALAGQDDSGRNHDFQFYGTGLSNTPGFSANQAV